MQRIKTSRKAVLVPRIAESKTVHNVGVSKNRGTPKWMVYKGNPYFLTDDLVGQIPLFLGSTPMLKHVEMRDLPPICLFGRLLKPATPMSEENEKL